MRPAIVEGLVGAGIGCRQKESENIYVMLSDAQDYKNLWKRWKKIYKKLQMSFAVFYITAKIKADPKNVPNLSLA